MGKGDEIFIEVLFFVFSKQAYDAFNIWMACAT